MAVYPGGGARNYGSSATAGGRSLNQFKASFFDREAIIAQMDKAANRALSKFGAFVRRRAQTSLRYRLKPSTPGSPPSAHRSGMSGIKPGNLLKKQQPVSPLRDLIFFAYDAATQSVIIGPTLTNQRNAFGLGGKTIPQVLEFGGRVGMHEHRVPNIPALYGEYAGQWVRTDLRYRRATGGLRNSYGRPRRIRQATYEARPYMRPAYEAELPQLVSFFKW